VDFAVKPAKSTQGKVTGMAIREVEKLVGLHSGMGYTRIGISPSIASRRESRKMVEEVKRGRELIFVLEGTS